MVGVRPSGGDITLPFCRLRSSTREGKEGWDGREWGLEEGRRWDDGVYFPHVEGPQLSQSFRTVGKYVNHRLTDDGRFLNTVQGSCVFISKTGVLLDSIPLGFVVKQ